MVKNCDIWLKIGDNFIDLKNSALKFDFKIESLNLIF